MSQLVVGVDPAWTLAQICMNNPPFKNDGLNVQKPYVDAHVTMLGDFVATIACCYQNQC
jgi:hypothetical protein